MSYDSQWVHGRLDAYEAVAEPYLSAYDTYIRTSASTSAHELAKGRMDKLAPELVSLEPHMIAIFERLWSDNWPFKFEEPSGKSVRPRLNLVRQLRVWLKNSDEATAHLGEKNPAPRMRADALHPWIWPGCKSLWATKHYADAVETAAKLVNAELQNKLGRRDASDSRLVGSAFSLNPPTGREPRLRLPGDRESETWRAEQEGAGAFGRGCFMAVRNVLAHNNVDLPEQQALERLAALSLLARWIDSADVERADVTGDLPE